MDREEVQTNTECANEQATAVCSMLSPIEDLPGTLQKLSPVAPLECEICGICPVTPTSGLPWPLDQHILGCTQQKSLVWIEAMMLRGHGRTQSVCYVHLEKEAWSLMDAGREAPSLNQLCIFFEELTVDLYPTMGYLLLELLSDANSGWCNKPSPDCPTHRARRSRGGQEL